MVALTVCGTQVSLIQNYCKTQQDLDMVLVIFIKEKILSALSCGCNINHSTNRGQHRLSQYCECEWNRFDTTVQQPQVLHNCLTLSAWS